MAWLLRNINAIKNFGYKKFFTDLFPVLYPLAISRGTILFYFLFNQIYANFYSLESIVKASPETPTKLLLTLYVQSQVFAYANTILFALLYGPVREHLFNKNRKN